MPIVFDEIEATVSPDSAASNPAAAESSAAEAGAQMDAHAVQNMLVRMRERAERLHAD